MYSNEQLIRDYLSNLSFEEIANSVHLIDINFERDSIESILEAILSLYLDVAETAKVITNGFIKETGEKILDNDDTRMSLINEHEAKENVLNKLLEYDPIVNELSKKIKTGIDLEKKQTY